MQEDRAGGVEGLGFLRWFGRFALLELKSVQERLPFTVRVLEAPEEPLARSSQMWIDSVLKEFAVASGWQSGSFSGLLVLALKSVPNHTNCKLPQRSLIHLSELSKTGCVLGVIFGAMAGGFW